MVAGKRQVFFRFGIGESLILLLDIDLFFTQNSHQHQHILRRSAHVKMMKQVKQLAQVQALPIHFTRTPAIIHPLTEI